MDFNFIYSNDQLAETVETMVKKAKKMGADQVEVNANENVGLEVSVRGGHLDRMEINREQGISISVLMNGASGVATVGDLNPVLCAEAIEKAIAIARATHPDPHSGLADASLMATDFPDLSLYHPWDIDAEKAISLASECEEASWAVNESVSKDKSDGAGVSSSASQSAYANSHGFVAAKQSTTHSINCGAVAVASNGEMERDGWSESERSATDLPLPEKIGQKAGHLASIRLGGKKIPDGQANVLFQTPVARSLIGHFVQAASGGALYRNTSWLVGRLGETIFPAHFSLQESPHLPKRFGSRAYDSDGVATQSRRVVANGVWEGAFLSAYSARRLGMTTTGNANGSHNLEVQATIEPISQLMKMVGTGLFITDLMGQGVNSITGDYSRGAAGFWLEDGNIAYPVSGITIAGNLTTMLQSIVAMGDDADWHGKTHCGSLLIPDLIIGGNT